MTGTTGARLRELRDRDYLSRAEVARRISVSERIVYGWEHDQYAPSAPHLRALARLYGVTPQYIDRGVETPAPSNLQEMLERQERLLAQIEKRLDALTKREALTDEQLAGLARLEQLTALLDAQIQATQPPRAQREGGSDDRPAN